MGTSGALTKKTAMYLHRSRHRCSNRIAMIIAAKLGFHPVPFDIGNAFVRASMGDIKVCTRLPQNFRNDNDGDDGKGILLKALDGLPISPRLWAKTLAGRSGKTRLGLKATLNLEHGS